VWGDITQHTREEGGHVIQKARVELSVGWVGMGGGGSTCGCLTEPWHQQLSAAESGRTSKPSAASSAPTPSRPSAVLMPSDGLNIVRSDCAEKGLSRPTVPSSGEPSWKSGLCSIHSCLASLDAAGVRSSSCSVGMLARTICSESNLRSSSRFSARSASCRSSWPTW